MSAPRHPAVVGVADHSGWANLVTLGADGTAPVVIDRRRCELVGAAVPRQPYHAAADLAVREAEVLIARVCDAARSGASTALGALVADLGPAHRVVALALRADSARALPDTVAGVLASHSAMHAAEGRIYREALGEAAEDLGIAVVTHARGHATSSAASALDVGTDRLSDLLATLGRSIGPPWQKEHREAACAALAELAGHAQLVVDA